jgi:WD40 repeat protein
MQATDEPAKTGNDEPVAPPATPTIKVEKTFGIPSIAFCAVDGAESGHVFAGLADFSVCRVDTTADDIVAAPISKKHHDSYVTGLVRKGNVLVSGGYDGSLIWWDAQSGELQHQIAAAHQRWIRMLKLSSDGSTLVSVGDDMQTKLWDLESHSAIATWSDHQPRTPHGYPSMLYAVAISPDGKWVATASRTGRIVVRSLEDHTVEAELESPVMYTWDPKARRHSIGGIRSLQFSPDSALLAVGGMGKVGNIDHLDAPFRIEIFNWRSGMRKHEIENSNHKGLVEAMAFDRDGKVLLATGGANEGFVSLYDTDSGAVMAEEKAPMHVHDFVINEEFTTLIAVGHEKGAVISLTAADSDQDNKETS